MIHIRTSLVIVLASLLLCGGMLASPPATAQLESNAAPKAPRVVRYVSSMPAHKGQACYGLVLADDKGIPTKVRVLSDHYPQLCKQGDSPYPQAQLMRWAFEAADTVATRMHQEPEHAALTEVLTQERLADIVLPPVAITTAELGALQRFVIGVGLNYADHLDEVGRDMRDEELLVFPKTVAPTGAYAPVRAGVQIGELPARPVLLLDYEAELGLVLLEDIDLHNPPPSYAAFINKVAFFTANDVSDREPIIRDQETGYTRGKSRPTYLPIGPWMVHGRHLKPRTLNEGEHSLEIGTLVLQAQPPKEQLPVGEQPSGEERQLATTDAMLRGPWAIVRSLSEIFKRGSIICMRDANGYPRFVHDANGVIPAGSIILTGTPGGTAIREPRLLEKAELFVRGGFSVEGARETFIEDMEQNIGRSAYLEIGDKLEGWVESLGRQRWSVAPDPERRPYGVETSGACEPGTRPQPLPQS